MLARELLALETVPEAVVFSASRRLIASGVTAAAGAGAFGDVHHRVLMNPEQRFAERASEVGRSELARAAAFGAFTTLEDTGKSITVVDDDAVRQGRALVVNELNEPTL